MSSDQEYWARMAIEEKNNVPVPAQAANNLMLMISRKSTLESEIEMIESALEAIDETDKSIGLSCSALISKVGFPDFKIPIGIGVARKAICDSLESKSHELKLINEKLTSISKLFEGK